MTTTAPTATAAALAGPLTSISGALARVVVATPDPEEVLPSAREYIAAQLDEDIIDN